MILRGQDFGNVFNSSGARGFFGEGYWYHRLMQPFGLNYEGSTFVAKTTTLHARAGNMPLDAKHRPAKLIPNCIVIKPWSGVVLNSVGLSGPGVKALLPEWSKRQGRFFISFMSVEASMEDRLREVEAFCEIIKPLLDAKGDQIGLQVNFSCPNVGHDPKKYAQLDDEMGETFDITEALGIPTLAKVNVLFPMTTGLLAGIHTACDGIIVSNTIPWGQLPDKIDWRGLFGSDVSPIAKFGYGGGGLSGKPLLPLVCEWIQLARTRGFYKSIVGGGGILSQDDAEEVLDSGADAIEIGSVALLRPWRVRGIISQVNRRTGN